MTVIELKSRAYDILAEIERLQYQLRQVNEAINKEANKVVMSPPEVLKEEVKLDGK
jgi:hypothetical protein